MMTTDDQRQTRFRQDWQEVCDKLQQLKRLDTGLLGEGASAHRYALRPPASAAQIKAVEDKLGVSLPAELAYFYSTVGDGGAGPCGGMASVTSLGLFQLDGDGGDDADDDDLKVAPRSRRLADGHGLDLAVTRLVPVMSREWEFYAFGSDEVLVSCSGPTAGSVFIFTDVAGDECFFWQPIDSLAELYLRWLEHDLAMFEVARKLVLSSDDIAEIWSGREAILQAEQESWSERAFEFREWYCSTTGWLHFNSDHDVLDWVCKVLGEDLLPTAADRALVITSGCIDFSNQLLRDRFRAARRRYTERA